jgi:hypothetical protein
MSDETRTAPGAAESVTAFLDWWEAKYPSLRNVVSAWADDATIVRLAVADLRALAAADAQRDTVVLPAMLAEFHAGFGQSFGDALSSPAATEADQPCPTTGARHAIGSEPKDCTVCNVVAYVNGWDSDSSDAAHFSLPAASSPTTGEKSSWWHTEGGGIAAVMCATCNTVGGHDDGCPEGQISALEQRLGDALIALRRDDWCSDCRAHAAHMILAEGRWPTGEPASGGVQPGRDWAVKHPEVTLVPQTESCARWTQEQIPGSVLVRWDWETLTWYDIDAAEDSPR